MTPFEFMTSAFYVAAGAVCLSVAGLVVFAVIFGVYRTVKGKEQEEREQRK